MQTFKSTQRHIQYMCSHKHDQLGVTLCVHVCALIYNSELLILNLICDLHF